MRIGRNMRKFVLWLRVGWLINDEKIEADLKNAITSLNNISQKIDKGRRTLGRLVNDDATIEKINQALKRINKFLSKQDKFRTNVDFSCRLRQVCQQDCWDLLRPRTGGVRCA